MPTSTIDNKGGETPLKFRIILDDKHVDVMEDEDGVPMPFQKRDKIPRTPTSGSPTRRESLLQTMEIVEGSRSTILLESIEASREPHEQSAVSRSIEVERSLQDQEGQGTAEKRPKEEAGNWCYSRWCSIQ